MGKVNTRKALFHRGFRRKLSLAVEVSLPLDQLSIPSFAPGKLEASLLRPVPLPAQVRIRNRSTSCFATLDDRAPRNRSDLVSARDNQKSKINSPEHEPRARS